MTHWLKNHFFSSANTSSFEFFNPGKLHDSELYLELMGTYLPEDGGHFAPYYRFHMYRKDEKLSVGIIDLRIGNSRDLTHYAGHIGYEVFPKYRGHHYAERSTRLLLDLARQHKFSKLWITCNPDNWPSRRTCERLGCQLVEIVAVPPWHELYHRGEHFKCRYRLDL